MLRITNHMKSWIDKTFSDILTNTNGVERLDNIFTKIWTRINDSFYEDALPDFFFGLSMPTSTSRTEDQTYFVTLCQQYYTQIFLMMYLAHLFNSATSQLCKAFQNEYVENSVGYVISVEKNLLDDLFGSKILLRKMLFGSSIIQEANDDTKVQIVVQGEGILQAIQCKLDINLPLKSYFIVSQVQSTYIHVSLNQVVKVASTEEDISAIVVKDKFITFKNANDILCETIWNHFTSTGIIDYCTLHKDDHKIDCNFFKSKDYYHALENLKYHILETVSILKHILLKDTYLSLLILVFSCQNRSDYRCQNQDKF